MSNTNRIPCSDPRTWACMLGISDRHHETTKSLLYDPVIDGRTNRVRRNVEPELLQWWPGKGCSWVTVSEYNFITAGEVSPDGYREPDATCKGYTDRTVTSTRCACQCSATFPWFHEICYGYGNYANFSVAVCPIHVHRMNPESVKEFTLLLEPGRNVKHASKN